jgi:alanine racemase
MKQAGDKEPSAKQTRAAAVPDDGSSGETPLRVVQPPRAAPAEAARVTRAEIDLARVRHNLHELRGVLKPSGAQLWAVIKADGYGHGARNIATALQQAKVDGICVALLEEGIELRAAGIDCPILVMGGYYGRHRDGVEALLEHRLTPVVYEPRQIDALAGVVRYLQDHAALPNEPYDVHLKIDTGMGRLGVRHDALDEVLRALRAKPELRVDGLMTHLACADAESLDVTRAQLRRFSSAEGSVRAAGLQPTLRHAANTAAMLRLSESHLDMVRPGIGLFGVHPCPPHATPSIGMPNLKPVMRVLSEVVALRHLGVGEAVGYGHTWRARRPSHIASLPMGYADGLNRRCSNGGEVLVCGKRAPIVGAISMDLTMIDVSDIDGISLRDEVVILGEQKGRLGSDAITADELARRADSISWECLTSISRRVPRFYRNP